MPMEADGSAKVQEAIVSIIESRAIALGTDDITEDCVELLSSKWVTFGDDRFGGPVPAVGVPSLLWDSTLGAFSTQVAGEGVSLDPSDVAMVFTRLSDDGFGVSGEVDGLRDCLTCGQAAESALKDWLSSSELSAVTRDPDLSATICARFVSSSPLSKDNRARLPMEGFVAFAPMDRRFATKLALGCAAEVAGATTDESARRTFVNSFDSEMLELKLMSLGVTGPSRDIPDAPEALRSDIDLDFGR